MSATPLPPTARLKWLFFVLNSYFASVEQQDSPHLRGRPVAVVPSPTDSTSAIAASYEAKAYGIRTGTKIYEAKRLCPDLICVLARHGVYVDYHHRILAEVERHIPIDKVCSIDEAACRLLNGEQSPEAATAIAQQIKQGLHDNVGAYVKCSIGIAQNMFLAKTATDMKKPDGLVILPPNEYAHQLFALELSDLCGIGRNILRRLNQAGIASVEQLWHASPKQARHIWGSVAGETFWYRLHGYDIADLPTQKRLVGHSRVLDPIHRSSDAAYPIVQQLTVKACTRLRRYGLHARRFSLHVGVQGPRTYAPQTLAPKPPRISWGQEISFAPTQDNETVLRALRGFWRQMQQETQRANLMKVAVTLSDLCEGQHITPDLFDMPKKAEDLRLSAAIDQLNARYGGAAVNLGSLPKTSAGHVGTKIAFSRIPEREEFLS